MAIVGSDNMMFVSQFCIQVIIFKSLNPENYVQSQETSQPGLEEEQSQEAW